MESLAPLAGAVQIVGRNPLTVRWLGRIAYREAWDLQRRLAAARADSRIGDQLLLLEHDAVLTLGRYADEGHVRAAAEELERRGIEVIRVERGGEVTYHGPGQLVAYPILHLSRRGLLLRPLVRALEGAMADTCAAFGVPADRREGHPGCWVDPDGQAPRKIGALGIRVQRGVSYHGIALNVTVDLDHFGLIDACGMPDVESTSIAREMHRPDQLPSTGSVAGAAAVLAPLLAERLWADLRGSFGPMPDPAAERAHVLALLDTADDSPEAGPGAAAGDTAGETAGDTAGDTRATHREITHRAAPAAVT